jgi:hypothetical protein
MGVAGCRIQDPAIYPVCEGVPKNYGRQGAEVSSSGAATKRTEHHEVQRNQDYIHTHLTTAFFTEIPPVGEAMARSGRQKV